MRKQDQYRDLPAADLEEEINTLVTTGLLFKNDRNSLFYQKFGKYTNEGSRKCISDNPKDSFSVLAERLDTLQNFFISEISDIKAEIKNKCNQKTSNVISTGDDEKIEFLQKQIIYLR